MNNLRTNPINISVSAGKANKETNKKLYTTKKANKKIGKRTLDINDNNLELQGILFFEEIGCSVELCQDKGPNYSFSKEARKKDGYLNTNKSFENKEDSFYEPDCGKQKPERFKKKQQQTTQISDLSFDLLLTFVDEPIEQIGQTEEEPLRAAQREQSNVNNRKSSFYKTTRIG